MSVQKFANVADAFFWLSPSPPSWCPPGCIECHLSVKQKIKGTVNIFYPPPHFCDHMSVFLF